MIQRILTGLLGLLIWASISCSNLEPSSVALSSSDCVRVSALDSTASEVGYCSTPQSYAGGVTITGTATFQAREIDEALSSPQKGLLAPGTPKPVRFAEYVVTDSAGSIVQCGETATDGTFSFTMPNSSSSYTLSVRSRANNNQLKASVMMCPETQKLYAIEASFTPSSSQSLGSINASATDTNITGGAFNILDQILNANDYLRTQVGNCSSHHSGCPDFVVAPKVSVYWEKGFNPATYLGGTSGSSYYLPGHQRLFILGGIDGDVDSSDTDHFDNSVILHEYAHFLEDAVSKSDSPGGSHDGAHLIDPRLAWGEGWANFFQAAVRNHPYYIDTYGNSDGTTNEYFRIDLEDQVSPIFDEPVNANEGNFREFSITRALWDVVDSANDSETISGGFPDIWSTLTSTDGYLHPSIAFRSVGYFHQRRDVIMSSTPDWSPVRTLAKHLANRNEYALWVTTGSSTCHIGSSPYQIDPTNVSSSGGTLPVLSGGALDSSASNSNLHINNDFFHYYHSGGALTLVMNYQTQSGTVNADLDLILYKGSAKYGYLSDIVNNISAKEGTTEPTSTFGAIQTETVTSSDLAAGHYLINVMVYTGRAASALGDNTYYELKANGVNLCPSTFPN